MRLSGCKNVGTKQKKNKGRHVCFYCAVFIQIIVGLAIIQREIAAWICAIAI